MSLVSGAAAAGGGGAYCGCAYCGCAYCGCAYCGCAYCGCAYCGCAYCGCAYCGCAYCGCCCAYADWSFCAQRLPCRRETRLLTAVAVPATTAVRAMPPISPMMNLPSVRSRGRRVRPRWPGWGCGLGR